MPSSYHEQAFDPESLRELIKSIGPTISKDWSAGKFDALAFQGVSGASVAFPLSFDLGIPIIAVRKKNENSHGRFVEGPCGVKKYAIIDDFICSGDTVLRIIESIQRWDRNLKPAQLYLYNHPNSHEFFCYREDGFLRTSPDSIEDLVRIPVETFKKTDRKFLNLPKLSS